MELKQLRSYLFIPEVDAHDLSNWIDLEVLTDRHSIRVGSQKIKSDLKLLIRSILGSQIFT